MFNPFGRVIHRCNISTEGVVAEDYGALYFDETFAFDDGRPDDVLHWAILKNGEGFDAAEPSVIGSMSSVRRGAWWKVEFKRHLKPPTSGPLIHYRAEFVQISVDVVLKSVALSFFGIPLARMEGFHERSDEPEPITVQADRAIPEGFRKFS